MPLPSIGCFPGTGGRLGPWLAPWSRASWTLSSRRGRCSWRAMIRSQNLLAPRSLARDGTAMACGRPTAISPLAGPISGSSSRCSSSGRAPHSPGRLPSWGPWSRPPEWDRAHGTRHRTPAHLARLLLARLVRWFPDRHFIFVGDTGDGTSETGRFCRQHRRHLTLVRQCYGNAAWYEPPSRRPRHTLGRPRVKGQKLPSPQAVVAHTTRRPRLTVAWYG
jgi:hypothetical protein